MGPSPPCAAARFSKVKGHEPCRLNAFPSRRTAYPIILHLASQAPSRRQSLEPGGPNGIRTRVSALRARRPRPLDYWAKLAGEEGFEPSLTEPESVVLPLHHSPKLRGRTAGDILARVQTRGNPSGPPSDQLARSAVTWASARCSRRSTVSGPNSHSSSNRPGPTVRPVTASRVG
jgi:hypothetical protein